MEGNKLPGVCVHAVVVAFHPDPDELLSLLKVLAPQVQRTIVVDNTPVSESNVETTLAAIDCENITLWRMNKNCGIAAGLNIGIRESVAAGASHVLFSDQDSLPAEDMVASLVQAYEQLVSDGAAVGAVGPTYTDRHTGIAFPFQAVVPGNFFYGQVLPDAHSQIVEALTLITSGCLVPIAVLDGVGGMREEFFIDQVDIEWCHRARAAGWRLYGSERATMSHQMGDDQVRVWFFGWRVQNRYPPVRLYYRFRNFVLLCRLPYVPLRWAIRAGGYWLFCLYAHAVFATNRMRNLRGIAWGLWDGIKGRSGPLPRSL